MTEDLADGKGCIGKFEGPETMYTPLFPLLTTGVYPFIGNVESAAHLVSLSFGIALVIPVFLKVSMIYGRCVSHISALFIAFHPLFVKLSGSVFNEAYIYVQSCRDARAKRSSVEAIRGMRAKYSLNCLHGSRRRMRV